MFWENRFSDIMTVIGLVYKMDIKMTHCKKVNSAWAGNFSTERCKRWQIGKNTLSKVVPLLNELATQHGEDSLQYYEMKQNNVVIQKSEKYYIQRKPWSQKYWHLILSHIWTEEPEMSPSQN